MDIRLVKDILTISTIVEVLDKWVRMGGNQWEQFVLPSALPSTVERQLELDGSSLSEQPSEQYHVAIRDGANADDDGDGCADVDADAESFDAEGEDEDEDDVVFVMGRDAEDTWAATRRQI